jgi:hypothetical protein
MLDRLPKLTTGLGIFCVVIGVWWGFLDGSDFAFKFFSDSWNRFITGNEGLFFIVLCVGILLSAGGTIAWTRHFSEGKQVKVAGCIAIIGLVIFMFVPNNVHGPGMLLGFAVICAWILSLVLVVIAFVAPDRPTN